MAKTALITGRYGFTGRYVAEALQQRGWNVVGLARSANDVSTSADVVADLLDPEQVTEAVKHVRPSAVLHLAAVAFVGHGNPDDFYRINLMGTRHLLEALGGVSDGLDAVVLASSANVYGITKEGALPEGTAMAPANDYAVSKAAMEMLAALWGARMPITITRPFNYTGRGQDISYLVPKIVDHFRRRAPLIELGNIGVERDFSDVRDVAEVYARLLENGVSNEVVNICSGHTKSLRSVIDLCEELTGHHIEVKVNPAFVRSNEVRTLSGDRRHLDQLVGNVDRVEFHKTLEWMLEN